MLASLRWLSELTGLTLSPSDVAEQLTALGLEVESQRSFGDGLDGIVLAQVVDARPHPSRDKLQLVRVDDGSGTHEIVCGASNVPPAGGRVVLARMGATLPNGLTISERKLGGVVSRGMLCGEVELDVGGDDSGLLIVEPEFKFEPGLPIAEALALRDTVLEIGLTPNRPDCLGHLGLARELCVANGVALPEPPVSDLPQLSRGAELSGPGVFRLSQEPSLLGVDSVGGQDLPAFSVEVVDHERCPRYGAVLVSGLSVSRSPFWVRYRLHVLGQRSINNLVDATNLIMLGFGHPIHGFDFDRLRGGKVVVRSAHEGERLRTLDGEDRALNADDLLICDGEGPVGLAGVMGGENSEINAETQRVLIECAYFAPGAIRRSSKRHGLHTEASHRFERGVDPLGVRRVLAHSAALLAHLGHGHVMDDALDIMSAPMVRPSITLRPSRLEGLLGATVSAERIQHVLEALGCRVTVTAAGFEVAPPGHRPDLLREADLIEEVARVDGYDQLPTSMPTIRPSAEGTAFSVRFIRRVREAAALSGLNEAVNYAFVSPRDLRLARLPDASVTLANPMSEERSVLRTGLLTGLVANLRVAQRNQVRRFSQFEVGRVFASGSDQLLPTEFYELCVCLWGERGLWYQEGQPMDFYDLKGVVSRVLVHSGAQSPVTAPDDGSLAGRSPFLHPKRRALLKVGDVVVGSMGELHPSVAEDLELVGRPQIANIRLDVLEGCVAGARPPQGKLLPKFPAVVRDLAVSVPESLSSAQVAEMIRISGGALVDEVTLFDVYTGPPVPAEHKSLAFHVVYRDPEATLTDKVVDAAHAKVVKSAEQKFAASVRK